VGKNEDDQRYKEDYRPTDSGETVEVKPKETKGLKGRSVAVRADSNKN
jgi:hypothetical protein